MIMVIMINFLVINVVKSIKKNLVELKFFPLFIRSTPQLYGTPGQKFIFGKTILSYIVQ